MMGHQAFMQRPIHPSYGRVKNKMWTGDYLSGRVKKPFIFNSYVSRSTERRTAQSALHIMLLRDIQGALQQTEVSNFSSVIMMICSLYTCILELRKLFPSTYTFIILTIRLSA